MDDTGEPACDVTLQERLIFELQSIRELNQRLKCLTDSGRPGGFPSHINLQVQQDRQQIGSASDDDSLLARQVERLKEQNKVRRPLDFIRS